MGEEKERKYDGPDADLVEDIDEEEMYELVRAAQREALEKARLERENPPQARPAPKWQVWVISLVFLFSSFAFVIQAYPIPAIEFLRTSAQLSADPDIQMYKKTVVSVVTDSGTGTGFAISPDGDILTNYHVIENKISINVAFPDDGLYTAELVESYPEIDLALLKVEGEDLPYLEIAEDPHWEKGDHVYFIGNPLRFLGIANQGTIIDYTQLKDWDDKVVMMEAPVYRGNSGSPVLNEEGDVIGVVFATLNHSEHGKVGLFVPIEYFVRADRS